MRRQPCIQYVSMESLSRHYRHINNVCEQCTMYNVYIRLSNTCGLCIQQMPMHSDHLIRRSVSVRHVVQILLACQKECLCLACRMNCYVYVYRQCWLLRLLTVLTATSVNRTDCYVYQHCGQCWLLSLCREIASIWQLYGMNYRFYISISQPSIFNPSGIHSAYTVMKLAWSKAVVAEYDRVAIMDIHKVDISQVLT